MTEKTRLSDLLSRVADLQQQGKTIPLDELCADCPELRDQLSQTLRQSSPGTDQRDGTDAFPPLVPSQVDGSATAAPSGRYLLAGEIARGGMGAVLRGQDRFLNRELAIKVLHERFRDQPSVIRRFNDEAQIGGQLQHPGIVPIYDLGVLPDGRPFLAMKLVKGRTLSELLKARPEPGHDLPRFLKIFEQVCQTMAYAHAHHVIHRDLKPANIMVGAFAEVQVMDWGIAKVLGKPTPAPSVPPEAEASPLTEIHSRRSDEPDSATQAGSVLGTYAYMAPEQARGQAEEIDERADVFGLGAILCEVLTGAPVYRGTREVMRVQALVADTADALARLDRCGADSELLALARSCLAGDREQRPRDAEAVAASMAAYLEGVQERLRQAEVDRAAAQVKAAEEGKRRRLTLVVAAALLLAMLAGGGAFSLVRQHRLARQEQTALLLSQALGQARALRDQAAALPLDTPAHRERAAAMWSDALAAVDQAEQVLTSGETSGETRLQSEAELAELRRQAAAADKDRRSLQRLEEIRQEKAQIRDADIDRGARLGNGGFVFNAAVAPLYAETFRACGVDIEKLSPAEAAVAIGQQRIRLEMALALDEWFLANPEAPRAAHLLETARAVDSDPFRDEVRSALMARDRQALLRLAAQPSLAAQPPATFLLLGHGLWDLKQRRAAAELLRQAQRRYPTDFWVNNLLGLFLLNMDPPQPEEAVRSFQAAQTLWPASYSNLGDLGNALQQTGDLDSAIRAYQECRALNPDYTWVYIQLCDCFLELDQVQRAQEVCQELLRKKPSSPWAWNRMGDVCSAQGKTTEAVEAYRKAVELCPSACWLGCCLGLALAQQGQTEQGLALCREAVRANPDDDSAPYWLGCILVQAGKAREAVEVLRGAVKRTPENRYVWEQLGQALSAAGQHSEAIDCLRQPLRVSPRRAWSHALLADELRLAGEVSEAIAEYREALLRNSRLVFAHNGLGMALELNRDYSGALAAYRAALQLQPERADTRANIHANLADVLRAQGDFKGALSAYKEALHLQPRDSSIHNRLGHLYWDQDKYADSIPHYRRAVELKPEDAVLHENLGNALRNSHDLRGAIAELREAARRDPKSSSIQANLALALWEAEEAGAAVIAGREALRLNPNSDRAHNALGLALEQQGHRDDAIGEYRQAIRLKPSDGVLHSNLGWALYSKGSYAEALAAFTEAARLLPKNAIALRGVGATQTELGQLDQGIASLRKAVELGPADSRCRDNLAFALYQKEDYPAAEAEARKAIALDPKSWRGQRVLGHILYACKKYDQAAAAYRQAMRLNRRLADLPYELGNCFYSDKKRTEAEKAFRQALALDSKHSNARLMLAILLLESNEPATAEKELRLALKVDRKNSSLPSRLSEALLAQGRAAEAIAAARQALALDPALPRIHFRLGEALAAQGSFNEAVAAFGEAERLGQKVSPELALPWSRRLRETSRALELDVTLNALLHGKLKVVDPAEQTELGRFCLQRKKLPRTAAALYAEAFGARPSLASAHRFHGACAAASAAKGDEPGELADNEKARLRQQALSWLQADLAELSARMQEGKDRPAIRKQLSGWQQARELAGVREPAQLAHLPREERSAWEKLWQDVRRLQEKSSAERGR